MADFCGIKRLQPEGTVRLNILYTHRGAVSRGSVRIRTPLNEMRESDVLTRTDVRSTQNVSNQLKYVTRNQGTGSATSSGQTHGAILSPRKPPHSGGLGQPHPWLLDESRALIPGEGAW